MEMLVHLGIGILISQSAEKLEYIGPYPDPICNITPTPFRPYCALPQSDSYKQTANFMCFGVLFAAIPSASATFGSEQVNYLREFSSGLQATPYFINKFIANFMCFGVCSLDEPIILSLFSPKENGLHSVPLDAMRSLMNIMRSEILDEREFSRRLEVDLFAKCSEMRQLQDEMDLITKKR